jgi:hypothetical protein
MDLIRQIHEELSGDDEWFVAVIYTEGNVNISGSSIDQRAALQEAVRIFDEAPQHPLMPNGDPS